MSFEVKSLSGWIDFFGQADIPVLHHTVRTLEHLNTGHSLNANSVADIVNDDPLMTVKLLRYMQSHKHRVQVQELIDVKQTLLMIGMETFFRDFPFTLIAEEMLREQREARIFLQHTVRRAQRSAWYAADWAIRLHDLHFEEVRVSALLTHVTEMLMWCFNPGLMLVIRKQQALEPTRRSAEIQKQVLGFAGVDLQRQLVTEWQLPKLLASLTDPEQADSSRVRTVLLAVRLARHSANGWHDPALVDDYTAIGELLHIDPGKVMSMVKTGPAAALS
jgi:HD-like signal output (HDOD) protein